MKNWKLNSWRKYPVKHIQEYPDKKELDQLCLDNIARFKRPKDYRIARALPKNNYGKIVKRELRNWLENETEVLE